MAHADEDEHEHHHHHHHDHDEDEHDHDCCCHHHHDEDDDEDEHEHHHEHHYDEHGVCSCGHHHHHDHDADEVFTSWGKETAHKYSREDLDKALHALDEGAYGMILRAKGIVDGGDTWYEFDMVPGEHEIRPCGPDVTGKLCVIGSQLKEHEIAELFHVDKNAFPLGEVPEAPPEADERACRSSPPNDRPRSALPHQSASRTASPPGEKPLTATNRKDVPYA